MRVVVTGANTGVGRATAEALAARGAEVVLACRSQVRAQPVLDAIGPRASFVRLDLASLESVRVAATVIGRERVDVLINNAAVAGARGQTQDGFELAFGVNQLGHFALTRWLGSALSPDSRVVHLGSGSHEGVKALDLNALRGTTQSCLGIAEYQRSKLCVMLFALELARRFEGSAKRSIIADPGDVASDAYRHMPRLVRALWTWRMKTPAEGARPSLECSLGEDVQNGGLYDAAGLRAPSKLARDPKLAADLWNRCESWIREPVLRSSGPQARTVPR